LLQGRPPRTGDEIALGTATLRQIGPHVGLTVTMTVGGRPLRERIVGRVVFPNFGVSPGIYRTRFGTTGIERSRPASGLPARVFP